jgi:excisionase family DNA binding protein
LSRDDWIRTSDHLHPKQPKVVPSGSQTLPIIPYSLGHDSVRRVQGSHDLSRFSRNFATNLLPPIEQLLTVSQVAKIFGVCTATVYSWAASGALPHIRIVNVIRVRSDDLAWFVTERHRSTGRCPVA